MKPDVVIGLPALASAPRLTSVELDYLEEGVARHLHRLGPGLTELRVLNSSGMWMERLCVDTLLEAVTTLSGLQRLYFATVDGFTLSAAQAAQLAEGCPHLKVGIYPQMCCAHYMCPWK